MATVSDTEVNLRARTSRVRITILTVVVIAVITTILAVASRSREAERVGAADVLTAQASLQGSWWESPADEAKETITEDKSTGLVTRSVPTRAGESQAVLMIVQNNSEYPVVFLGHQSPERFVAQISDRPLLTGIPDPRAEHYVDAATLAPGEFRFLRVDPEQLLACAGYDAGTGTSFGGTLVRVEIQGQNRSVRIEPTDEMRIIAEEDEPYSCD